MERQGVRKTVFHKEVFGSMLHKDKYEADGLAEVAAWAARTLTAIPEAYRDSARLAIDSVGGYEGEHHAEVTVYYMRPETDKELADRVAEVEEAKREREAKDRQTLADLQAKYGSTP